MPIYEYFSPDTNKIYSFFARSSADKDTTPRCPDDPDASMQKVMSGFAVTGRAKENAGDPGEDFDDPRIEAAMAEMEREMAGMDEDNPDPRQMGRLMRKMADMTGEKMPAVMEEMVGRLEAGEDPDKIEEEYGDLPELEEFGAGLGENGEPEEGSTKSLLRRLRGPVRDAQLYELRDYL
ncbi:MAG: cytochrome C [Puniceicoccaceae bacterium]